MTKSNPKVIVGIRNKAYCLTHTTITEYEKGKIVFVDSNGKSLTPEYFGAGLSTMNGILR